MLTEHFRLEEFVPKSTFKRYGQASIWFIDKEMVLFAEKIRTFTNKPVTINNWYAGGPFNYRGFRPPDCTQGAVMSQHRFGRALDISIMGLTIGEVSDIVIKNRNLWWPWITAMEDPHYTPTWLHVDKRNTNSADLLIVDPS